MERAPLPLAIDAPWALYEPGAPLRFAVYLLGEAGTVRDTVTEGLVRGFVEGMNGTSRLVSLVARGWRAGSAGAVAGPGDGRLRVTLLTPLRLVRAKRDLEAFDLEAVVRDLGFRLAVWGHYHQGLPWPAPWRFLHEDARAARVDGAGVRRVSFHRYSGRQDRLIPMKGLMGTVELSRVSPDLDLLLRAGAICGLGKGSSIGLGRITMQAG